MKLSDFDGIISSDCLVTIIEYGHNVKDENLMIPYSKALDKFGCYTVTFIHPFSSNVLDIAVMDADL